jgi:hypothetical protein
VLETDVIFVKLEPLYFMVRTPSVAPNCVIATTRICPTVVAEQVSPPAPDEAAVAELIPTAVTAAVAGRAPAKPHAKMKSAAERPSLRRKRPMLEPEL